MRKLRGSYRRYRENLKVEKCLRMAVSTRIMDEQGVKYKRVKSGGIHTVVERPHGLIDYWPTTGKWICRETGLKRFGVGNLISYLGYLKHVV